MAHLRGIFDHIEMKAATKDSARAADQLANLFRQTRGERAHSTRKGFIILHFHNYMEVIFKQRKVDDVEAKHFSARGTPPKQSCHWPTAQVPAPIRQFQCEVKGLLQTDSRTHHMINLQRSIWASRTAPFSTPPSHVFERRLRSDYISAGFFRHLEFLDSTLLLVNLIRRRCKNVVRRAMAKGTTEAYQAGR